MMWTRALVAMVWVALAVILALIFGGFILMCWLAQKLAKAKKGANGQVGRCRIAPIVGGGR